MDPAAELEGEVRGEVLTGAEYMDWYSVDAGSYRVRPAAVVVAADAGDAAAAVRAAGRLGTGVTVRGGGTGLVGGALNSGIILDLRRLDSVKVGRDRVTAGPGATRGALDCELESRGMFLGPNPSVGPFCTVGGMVGCNAAGSRSLKYGCIIDNLLGADVIDGTGRRVSLPADADLSRRIAEAAAGRDPSRFPRVSKNSSGYRADAVTGPGSAHKIIAGSEGTLGIVVSAVLGIRRAPAERALFVLEYGSGADAAADCARILPTGPSAVEYVDGTAMAHMPRAFGPGARCLLMVEYDDRVGSRGARLRKEASGRVAAEARDPAEMSGWWRHRNSALRYSLESRGGGMPDIIEDAAVPAGRAGELLGAVESVDRRFGTRSVVYGHIGDGNLHVRPAQGGRPADPREVARAYFAEVARLGGTITAEHGDGLARTPFLACQYGAQNMRVFGRLKALLDPGGVLNPGKITGPLPA